MLRNLKCLGTKKANKDTKSKNGKRKIESGKLKTENWKRKNWKRKNWRRKRKKLTKKSKDYFSQPNTQQRFGAIAHFILNWSLFFTKMFIFNRNLAVRWLRFCVKPRNVVRKSLRASRTTNRALHQHEALRDFVQLGFCTRQNPAQSPVRCR